MIDAARVQRLIADRFASSSVIRQSPMLLRDILRSGKNCCRRPPSVHLVRSRYHRVIFCLYLSPLELVSVGLPSLYASTQNVY